MAPIGRAAGRSMKAVAEATKQTAQATENLKNTMEDMVGLM